MQTDPQRFNLYAYVRNNPLRFIDPKGEAIELFGTEEERQRVLAALQSSVGKDAGQYLYIDTKTDSNGTRYFVGIKDGGPNGHGKDFKNLNSVAGEIAPIIRDTKIVGIRVVEQGAKVGKSTISTNEDICKCNSIATGATKIENGQINIYLAIPKPGDAYDRAGVENVSASEMESFAAGKNDIGIVIAHELGHALAPGQTHYKVMGNKEFMGTL